jgi:hypothetical protein
MYTLLYVKDDQIISTGSFGTEDAAIRRAKKIQHGLDGTEKEFDINEQNVYIISSSGRLTRLMISDLDV